MSIDKFSYFGGSAKEKHWTEIAEEEVMMQRAIQEAISQQSAQAASSAGPAGGAGGVPAYKFFNPTKTTAFSISTGSTSAGPLRVTFINQSSTDLIGNAAFNLTFGVAQWYSSDPNCTYLYANTGSFTASLTSTTYYGGVVTTATPIGIIVTSPTLTASASYVTSSGPAPVTATFTNLTVNTSGEPTTTYVVHFGDRTSASYTNSPTANEFTTLTHVYANTGSFTASICATGSYNNVISRSLVMFYAPPPSLTARFTFTTSSNSAPSTATFLNTINGTGTLYNGNGGAANLTYLWNLGSGSITSTEIIPVQQLYTVAGNYTASLQVTESLYNIKSLYTASFRIA